MSNEFNLQRPSDESGEPAGLDIERMAMELDAFVNEVSLELSVISRQLGQTPDVRTHSENGPAPQKPSPAERQPIVARPPLVERKPTANLKPVPETTPPPSRTTAKNESQPESRIQAIRDRLARVNPGTTGEEKGNRKHD